MNKDVIDAIARIVFCIFFTICLGITLSTCKLDSETIAQCEETCGDDRGVKEVTSTKCKCNEEQRKLNSSKWVIPRK